MASVLVLNGPNLNLLGTRQPEIYGRETLADIEVACRHQARSLSLDVDFRQSNHEGVLIDWIQQAPIDHAALIINPAAYSHTSVAVLDALLTLPIPVIEVHLSNIHKRDDFRHHSYVSRAATGVICGLGSHGYLLALDAVARLVSLSRTK